jgi:NhaP-type Na+/H+ and K+/H+ antiporter
VLNAVGHDATGEALAFSDMDFEIEKGGGLDGIALKNFRSLAPGDTLITLVERGETSFLPSGATTLQSGDRVHIFAREADMNAMFRLSDGIERNLLKIGVVGGGRIGAFIVEGLLEGEAGSGKKEKGSAYPSIS